MLRLLLHAFTEAIEGGQLKARIRSAVLWALWACLPMLGPEPACARDIYAFRLLALGPVLGAFQVSYSDNLLFLNTGATPAVVTLLGMSDGSLQAGIPLEIAIAPGQVATLTNGGPPWEPAGVELPATWFLHLDVPDTVVVTSRVELGRMLLLPPPPSPGDEKAAGVLPLPVFTHLVPAGQVQYHLSADLGTQPAHVSVAVFNAGTQSASASVSLHDGCTGAVLASMSTTIPPNASRVVGPFPSDAPDLQICTNYVTLVEDQPGLSVISVVDEQFDFSCGIQVPTLSE